MKHPSNQTGTRNKDGLQKEAIEVDFSSGEDTGDPVNGLWSQDLE